MRRVRVTKPSFTSESMYSSQMRGILCIVASARSKVLCSASRAMCPGGRLRTAAVRSLRYRCQSCTPECLCQRHVWLQLKAGLRTIAHVTCCVRERQNMHGCCALLRLLHSNRSCKVLRAASC